MRETQVQSLSWEDPLDEEIATHSRILVGKSHEQRILVGYYTWGHKETQLRDFTFTTYLQKKYHGKNQTIPFTSVILDLLKVDRLIFS